MKKVYKYWTVQSSNLKDFDNEINANLEIGWEILESGYSIIKSEEGEEYSQVLFWKDEEKKGLSYEFNSIIDETGRETMEIQRRFRKKNGTDEVIMYKKRKGFGKKYVKRYFESFPLAAGGAYYPKFSKTIDEDGNVVHLIQYAESEEFKNHNGQPIGEFINGPFSGNFDKRQKKHEFWNYEEGIQVSFDLGGNEYLNGLFTYRNFFYIDISKTKIRLSLASIGRDTVGKAGGVSSLKNFLKINKTEEIKLLCFKSGSHPFGIISMVDYPKPAFPSYFFRGIILNENEQDNPDNPSPLYYVKKGLFKKICERTGKTLYELNILDGNWYDGILRGSFKKFKNGESLPIKLIENGLLKDKPGLD